MKRIPLFLLSLATLLTGVFFVSGTTVTPDDCESEGVVVQVVDATPVLRFEETRPAVTLEAVKVYNSSAYIIKTDISDMNGSVEQESTVEEKSCRDDIPLTYEEQEWLLMACEENGIPYALALGLIEKESAFRNILGDNGASAGYMQIQQKWHWDRMERLGVTDLTDPQDNFRVGCDFLAELYTRYNDWYIALTAYNMGCNPGYITNYAYGVMENYANWQKLLDTCG